MNSTYRFRVSALCILFLFLLSAVAVRLYIIQVVNFGFFSKLAHDQYTVRVTTRPERGAIFDRNDNPLALSHRTQSVFTTPSNIKNRKFLLELIEAEFPSALSRFVANPKSHFCWLERNIGDNRYEKLKNIPDLFFVKEPQRFYPFPSTASVVGEVNVDNVGIGGIELMFEKTLRSTTKICEIKRDARFRSSKYFDRSIIETGSEGEKISLTIDGVLQQLVHEELSSTLELLKAKEGAVVILDPDTGEILVMDSASTDTSPIRNIPITDCFEPGSSIKAFATCAALTEGVTEPDEMIDCCGKEAMVGRFLVSNWKPFGILSFSDVIRRSSNVGLAKVALRLGPKIYDYYRKFGFGSKTGVELPGERSGFVNPPDRWSRGSNQVLSFGYEMSVTLLQLARAMCCIANGGRMVKPKVLRSADDLTTLDKDYDLSTETTKEILKGIGKRYPVKRFQTYGKTGTARCLVDGEYSSTKHVYSFIGVVERGFYKRVIGTYIREPQRPDLYAAQVTAPLFARVGKILTRYEIGNI